MTPDMPPKWTINRNISVSSLIQIVLILAAVGASYFHTQVRVDAVERALAEHIKNHDSFVRADVQAIRGSSDIEWRREIRERLSRVEQKLDAHMIERHSPMK